MADTSMPACTMFIMSYRQVAEIFKGHHEASNTSLKALSVRMYAWQVFNACNQLSCWRGSLCTLSNDINAYGGLQHPWHRPLRLQGLSEAGTSL